MDTPAPDISRGYPSAGERIGPAWREIWGLLNADNWADGNGLARMIADRHGLSPSTVGHLLSAARRAGILEKRMQRRRGWEGGQPTAHYRVRTGDTP